MSEAATENDFTCPVCRAVQQRADACRRCRCDLRLVLRAEGAARDARRRLLLHLAAKRWPEALREARTFHALQPAADSRRLLAVCCLLAGDFSAAARWAEGID
jgi:hypothetical protein